MINVNDYYKAVGTKPVSTGLSVSNYYNAIKPTVKPTIKTTTSKPILTITPTQKKLSTNQLTQVGLDKQQAVLKQAPKQNLWDKITTKISEAFDSPKSQQARAMNAMAVKKQPYGKNLDVVKLAEKGGNPLKNTLMEDVTKELGIRTAPTTKEFGETILGLAVGTGLVTAPLKMLGGIATFAGLNEFKSGLISAIKGKGFKIGANQTLSDIVPNAPTDVKNVLDLVDFLATAKLSEKVIKSSPEAFEKLTKDTIVKYKMPETVKIPASEVKRVVIGTNTGIEKDILSKLDLTSEQWSKAVKDGIAIDVPAEKITRIVDKPYWEKLKSLIGKEPTNIVNVEGGGQSKVNDVKALLGPGEHTPQEVIGKVIGQGVEKTPEGKALLKQAVEAQKQGTNVLIEKPPQPPVEGGVGGYSKKLLDKQGIAYTPEQASYITKDGTMIAQSSAGQHAKMVKDIGITGKEPEATYMKTTGDMRIKTTPTEVNISFHQKPTAEQLAIIEKAGQGKKIIFDDYTSGKVISGEGLPSVVGGGVKEGGITTPPVSPTVPKVSGGEVVKEPITAPKPVLQPKIVSVPREQLPQGVGEEKVSKLEARVQKAVGNIPQETIDKLGLSTYKELNKKENIRKASEYALNNPEDALKVLKGEIEAPKGILRNAIYVAMQNEAIGNVELARKLASITSTRLGQEIGILSEVDPNSPVKLMSDIVKFREKANLKRYGKDAVKNIKKDIKKQVKAPDKYDWSKFLDSIEC